MYRHEHIWLYVYTQVSVLFLSIFQLHILFMSFGYLSSFFLKSVFSSTSTGLPAVVDQQERLQKMGIEE